MTTVTKCPTCGFKGVPLTHCAVCGTLIPGLTPPLAAEIDSLRAQLSVARAQTASDRELIVELREALEELLDAHACNSLFSNAGHWERAREVLGKVSP